VCGEQVPLAFAALGALRPGPRRKGGPQASQRELDAFALNREVGIEQGLKQEPGEQRMDEPGGVLAGLIVSAVEDCGDVRAGVAESSVSSCWMRALC
jgi:hypothetical protein